MKKQIFWLGTLGAAAGFLYVLGSTLRKQNGNGNAANGESGTESEPSAKRKRQTATRANVSNTKRANGRLASMAKVENGKPRLSEDEAQPAIDDQGTDQIEAAQILKDIRDNAFDSSNETLALALGRPTEEIDECTSGHGMIDGDLIMKARALAMQRGVEGE